ncbi:MAG: hypothetical protein HQK77_15325 [Desulfobacterales bacterium]|nr:hypothetical protein [Desulfobacterales bacterium]
MKTKMTTDSLAEILNVFTELGYEARSYSGRGMYGKHCLGVIIPQGTSAFTLGMELVRELGELGDEYDYLFGEVAQDSMGYDTIVYFRRIEFTQEMKRALDEGYSDDEDELE